ncbi:extracellular solute-binding protein [Shinella sp. AETb1-6]|jgi:putative spermidine/putrescine transport system substrate-binding protein|nr:MULTISPECIES: extracellular solute-binding protein [Shinella]MCD1262402.1 extracellular solute-binding protein [Shinella sumterensis]MXN50617.1 extracellular solute-binding protein [Shinella sp. AETb1-6]TFE99924.1 ABC transporter [Shinella sumterensis]WLS11129.1 extracellular solute-binding protein [Shinella sumterensis]
MKKISRALALTMTCALALPAFAQDKPVAGEVKEGSLKGKTLTFVSYGGIYQDGQVAALKEFVDKSGVTLLNDGPTEIAKLKAQVDAGNVTWDVVDTADLPPYVHCGTLFQKLDLSKLDVSKIPQGQVGECSVPAMNYGVVLMYKNEAYKDNPPKSWADFFDTEKFPGVRAIDGSGDPTGGLIEQAFKAAGGDPKAMTSDDIEKGIQKLRDLGPDTIYWKTGAESQQLAESGEADMIMMWTGRAMTAVKNGAAYTPVWQDWLVVMDQLTIPVGVKDTDAAYALINAYLGANAQAVLTEKTSYTPINMDAKPKVDEATAAFLTSTPERNAQGYQQNIPFWVKNFDLAAEKWNALLSGN